MSSFINKVQMLLDEGNSPTSVASLLNVHHSKVCRLLNRGEVEIYVAFDEENTCVPNERDDVSKIEVDDWIDSILKEALYSDVIINHKDSSLLRIYGGVRDFYGSLKEVVNTADNFILLDSIYFTCCSCDKIQSLRNSQLNRKRLLGYFGTCNSCKKVIAKNCRKRNPQKFRDRLKRYASRNKEAIKEMQKNAFHKRRALKKALPNEATTSELRVLKKEFNNRCLLTGDNNVDLDHFIPLTWGHGGHYKENLILLESGLNNSKWSHNPFQWAFDLELKEFNKLINYLSKMNFLTEKEYETFVNWCYANQRTVDEIKRDQRHSIEIFREATGLQFPLPKYALNAPGRRSTDDPDYGNSHGEVS